MHCFLAWYRVCQGLAMLTLAALVIITMYFLCWAYSYSRYYFNKITILVIVGGTGKYNMHVYHGGKKYDYYYNYEAV